MRIKNVYGGKSQSELHRNTEFKTRLLISASDEIKQVITVPTCCIERNQYPVQLRESDFFDEEMGQNILERISAFQRSNYERLNSQDAVLSGLTLGFSDYKMSLFSDNTISKFGN